MAMPEVLRRRFLVHDGAPDGVWGLDEATLEFLFDHVQAGMRTLETGAGMSTVLFAYLRAGHTCVVPSEVQTTRIREHCALVGIPLDDVTFIVEPSERALPRLDLTALDLVLIDGRHGFPAPMIDWYYTAGMLRVGGLAVIDDTQIWSVRLLCNVLRAEPEWELVRELPKGRIFRKLAAGAEDKEWVYQRHVVAESAALARTERIRKQLATAAMLLSRGRLVALARALGREVVRRVRSAPDPDR